MCSPGLKLVLRHSLFYFNNFGGFFASIGGTIANIKSNTCVRRLLNWFYDIRCSLLTTLEDFLCRLEVPLQRYEPKRVIAGFETVFTSFAFFFEQVGCVFESIEGNIAKLRAKMSVRQL